METIPNEIIEQILEYPVLSLKDIVNFSSVCSKFRDIVISNSALWKIKYFQCWPDTNKFILVSNWFDECKTRKLFERKALDLLVALALKFQNVSAQQLSSSNLDFFAELVNSHRYGYHYMRDFLLDLNLWSVSVVQKLHVNTVLTFIHKRHCTQLWHDLMRLNPKEKTLEKGAAFVSLWFYGTERVADKVVERIVSELNQIADLAKKHLFQVCKDHPLKQVPEEVQLQWREQNLGDNIFKPSFCVSIIDSINYVLCDQLQYFIVYNSREIAKISYCLLYATANREASLLAFAVIYESVARRLGVQIEVLDFMDHCLLKWRESYSTEGAPFHYINMAEKGKFMKSRCPRQSGGSVLPCDMQQIAQKMAEKMQLLECRKLVS